MTNFSDYLDSIKGQLEESADEARSEAISEGLSNMKESIADMQFAKNQRTNSGRKSDLGKWSEGIKRSPKPVDKNALADRAIDTYKKVVLPKKEVEPGVEHPTEGKRVFTKAEQDSIVAAARSLAGQRNSGTVGKTSQVPADNPGRSGNTGGHGDYAANVSSFTLEEKEESLEEYQARVFESFGLTEAEKPFPYGKVGDKLRQLDRERKSEKNPEKRNKLYSRRQKVSKEYNVPMECVAALADALNIMEDCSWQQVDKTTREIAVEYGTTLKALNKAFREEFGQYPDKWIGEQVIAEECGVMPLCEVARIHETGMLYDVTLMWRGKTQRLRFFWPEAGRPSREDMQNAVEKFYPTGRLIAYYPSRDQSTCTAFAMVPPMSESYVALDSSDWVELSEEDAASYEHICTEVGEPVFSPVVLGEGKYAVLISDHETGEEWTVTFGEGIMDVFKDKRSSEEKRHVKLTKMANELDRLEKHTKDTHSDIARSPRKAPETKKVYARKVSEKKPVVREEKGCKTLKSKKLRQDRQRFESFVRSLG